MLALSALWIIISLFCNKEFKAFISLKLLLGLFVLKISKEENTVSKNLDFMVIF